MIDAQAKDRTSEQLVVSSGLVVIFWLVATSRWIVSNSVVPWDSKNQFYAFFRFLSATLHAGDWPFWNPYHYGGHPSVADPQSLVLSPIFFIWGALDPAPTMRMFDLVILAHLLAGGIAIAGIGWRARWPVPASVLAAGLFMFGGAASGRLQHTGIILSYSLFPLALLLLRLALERRSHTMAAGFAIVAANMALGRNQVALLLCALLLAAAVAEVLWARPAGYLRARLGVLATMAVVVGLLLAVPVLLTLQFADLSNRPIESLDVVLRGSLHPANLATMAIPNIFGTHTSYWGPGAATLPEVALTDDSENYLFVGVIPVLLVLWLGVAGGSAWRPGRRLMTGTLAIACLFMLGRYTPLYALAFRFVPAISLFRRPTDASFVFGIALAILAGHCLADYAREGLPRFRPPYVIAVISMLVAIIGWAVLFSARTGHALNAVRDAAITGVAMLVAIAILVSARQRPAARFAAASLVTLIALAELLWWNAASRLNAQSRALYAVLEEPVGAEAAAIGLLETAIAKDHTRGDHPRVEVVGLGGAWQNLAMVRGWEATNGYNPLRIGFYDRLVAPGEENWDIAQRRFPPSFDNYDSALARALGLTYLVLGQPLDRMPGLARLPAADLLLAGPPVWIYRLAGAMPRASLMGRIEFADADATWPGRLLIEPTADRALVDTKTLPRRSTILSTSDAAGAVTIVSSRPGRVELVANSADGGLLTLHDTDYPGWIAEIDGRPAPILRDILFQGIEVPSGKHNVRFRFAPFSSDNLRSALNAILARRAGLEPLRPSQER